MTWTILVWLLALLYRGTYITHMINGINILSCFSQYFCYVNMSIKQCTMQRSPSILCIVHNTHKFRCYNGKVLTSLIAWTSASELINASTTSLWPFCAATWRQVHPSCNDKYIKQWTLAWLLPTLATIFTFAPKCINNSTTLVCPLCADAYKAVHPS